MSNVMRLGDKLVEMTTILRIASDSEGGVLASTNPPTPVTSLKITEASTAGNSVEMEGLDSEGSADVSSVEEFTVLKRVKHNRDDVQFSIDDFTDLQAARSTSATHNCRFVWGNTKVYQFQGKTYEEKEVKSCPRQKDCGTQCLDGYVFGRIYGQKLILIEFNVGNEVRLIEKEVTVAVGCSCIPRPDIG